MYIEMWKAVLAALQETGREKGGKGLRDGGGS